MTVMEWIQLFMRELGLSERAALRMFEELRVIDELAPLTPAHSMAVAPILYTLRQEAILPDLATEHMIRTSRFGGGFSSSPRRG